jgi:hypothetical protein
VPVGKTNKCRPVGLTGVFSFFGNDTASQDARCHDFREATDIEYREMLNRAEN